jgi:hypothetical protein
MKIYKISVRNTFDIVANYLSKETFAYIKNLITNKKIKKGFGYNFSLKFFAEEIKKEIKIKLKIAYLNESRDDAFSVNGNYVARKNKERKSDFVIEVGLYSNFSKQFYPVFVQKLSNVLRHELEHFRQDTVLQDGISSVDYDRNKLNSKDILENFYERLKYIRDQLEQEAFIREYMRYAKRIKQSIFELLEQFINQHLFKNDPNIEENIRSNISENLDDIREDLRKIYRQKVNLIYPKINLPRKNENKNSKIH